VVYNGAPIGDGPQFNKKRAVDDRFDPSAKPLKQFGILQAIRCGDIRIRYGSTGDDFQRYYNELKQVSKYGAEMWLTNIFACEAWQIDAKQKPVGPFTGVAPSANILYMNGIYDPVTPLLSANASSAGFAGSGVLVSEGAGVSHLPFVCVVELTICSTAPLLSRPTSFNERWHNI
jgi:hypothetical protein